MSGKNFLHLLYKYPSIPGNILMKFINLFLPPFQREIFVWQPDADTPIKGLDIKQAIRLFFWQPEQSCRYVETYRHLRRHQMSNSTQAGLVRLHGRLDHACSRFSCTDHFINTDVNFQTGHVIA